MKRCLISRERRLEVKASRKGTPSFHVYTAGDLVNSLNNNFESAHIIKIRSNQDPLWGDRLLIHLKLPNPTLLVHPGFTKEQLMWAHLHFEMGVNTNVVGEGNVGSKRGSIRVNYIRLS